jgi:flavin-dependent dehydrogenase
MNIHFNVFIIGGGMAGLNTARLLLESTSLTIGLADTSRRSPRNNPARLTFMDIIAENDFKDCILNTYKSFGIFTYHGAKSVHQFNDPVFVALDYNKACDKLLTTINQVDRSNFYHERVVQLEILDDYAKITLRSGLSFTADLVVDASGKSHFTSDNLKGEKPKLYSHSFGQTFENCRISQPDVACFIGSSVDYGSGGGWYYPLDQTHASVGFAVITDNRRFPARELRDKFSRAIREVKPICDFLSSAIPIAYETGTIPIQPLEKPYGDRLLIVGDAAGQATSWMCMGVEPVLKNSQLAVHTIIEAYEKKDFREEKLADYKKAWDQKNKQIFDQIEKQKTKIWFLGEDVWEFILKKDLANLSSQQLYERIRSNAHLMPLPLTLWRWFVFRLRHFKERKKYKQHINARLP